ncbi:hypothetical protein K2173_025712 [Erythroxylum novogranatense]|uniref:Uncharacterized protein n=1 Tax=Erythroxylum novogranatense TaxID=1862640 RepID=A0AAV8SBD2_9ROSI|nr:hypothetical protein K2173_025712 [Erythroxylum novogranatense]
MAGGPSLLSLCIEAVKAQIVSDDLLPDIYELPIDLFDILVLKLPPLALHRLQTEMPYMKWNDYENNDDCPGPGRKRGRHGNFDKAWKGLFKLRWPKLVDSVQSADWQQMYWQTHLQSCFDEAAELALLPSFDGCLGELNISAGILRCIGCKEDLHSSILSKLSYHCQHFGHHARCLRLQNVLCVAETCQLLGNSKLQSLVLRWIRSKEHVDGLCKLLIQNSASLTSLELLHCKLSPTFINDICGSVCIKNMETHKIQHFSITSSSFSEIDFVSFPSGLVSFLASARYLSLRFRDNHLDCKFAQMLFTTICDTSSKISALDLSDNNIAGSLSNFNCTSTSRLPSSSRMGYLQTLRMLNVRGNNLRKDDAENLRYALVWMSNLEILDLSDNPIGDEGIGCLIPYFLEATEKCCSLVELNLESCELSCSGVTELLDALSTSKRQLKSISLADNGLGRQAAGALGKLLGMSIRSLNIGGIGLGSAGFQELEKGMKSEMELVEIDISKNRGGYETAKFLSKLISLAPNLIAVNAAYNLMPVESLNLICTTLKVTKGKLERLNLTGNTWGHHPSADSLLTEFQRNGRPILVLPSTFAPDFPYDDDP